ncbi:MAG: DUF4178 domain-containing protein [Myxococcales bacterium]|nr:DUF4178 domain-containing protein [Myxococcales bacterium]MCB9673154.1 DUF4178 domain-containing protein [Alphaproteobacteria bacterium]
MAKVRAKTLTCPSCGSAVPVRNVFKAKLVVCPSCDSQLDLTTPDFQVLGKLPDRAPPQDAVCLGLKGKLEDGRAFEIVGRLRFTDYDDEESWFWDEWLLLAENGEYLWLQEEGRSFELHTRFVPDNPPDLDTLNSSRLLAMDGTEYRVKERGTPRISYVEGELTWRAKVGDSVAYIDARGPGGGFGVEFTDDEIEFFRRKRLSRFEGYRLVGLQELLDLEDRRDELRAEYQKGPKAMGCGGMIMAGGALMAFFLFVVLSGVGGYAARSTSSSTVDVASLQAGKELGKAKLSAGSEYRLDFDAVVHPSASTADLAVRDPRGVDHVVLKVSNLQKTGPADLALGFRAEQDGEHVLHIKGTAGSLALPSGTATPGSSSTGLTNVRWSVKSRPIRPDGFVLVGPILLLGALAFFLLGAGRTSAASARAAREYRRLRAELIEEIHRKSRVQES